MKIKKLISAVAALAIAVSCCPVTAFAADTFTIDKHIDGVDYHYRVNRDDSTAEVLGCQMSNSGLNVDRETLVIPSEVDGYTVTKIAESAFEGNDDFENIVLPDTITEIGQGAFRESSIFTVNIPAGITVIEENTFNRCQNLKSIVIPEGVVGIEENAFAVCISLSELSLPDSLVSIGDGAFMDCRLISLTIPENVEYIDGWAFSYNNFLESVDCLSYKLKSVLYTAFAYTPFGDSAWADDVFYLNNCLVGTERTVNGEFRVKDGTTSISELAFADCREITSIYYPLSVTWVGDNAYRRCSVKTIEYEGMREQWNEVHKGINYKSANYIFAGDASGFLYGDVNDDGAVNLIDLLVMKKYIAGLIGDDKINTENGDLYGDGDGITGVDLLHLKRMIAEM